MIRRLLFCILLFCILFTSRTELHAKSYVNYKITKSQDTIKITFPKKFYIDKIIIPAESFKLWGKYKCKLLAIQAGNTKKACSITRSDLFEIALGGIVTNKILITPIIKQPTKFVSNASIFVDGSSIETREIETSLSSQADQLIQFHAERKCFSCHTLYPFAISCRLAHKKGLKIPTKRIVTIGKQLLSMQNKNGYFSFLNQPKYGKITTTLCAGAIFSELLNIDPIFFKYLEKIALLIPKLLQQKDNKQISDFNYPPFYIGDTTCNYFISKIISRYFYSSISKKNGPNYALLKILKEIRLRYVNLEKLTTNEKILVLLTYPYGCSITPENYVNQSKLIAEKIINNLKIRNIFSLALTNLILKRANMPLLLEKSLGKNNILNTLYRITKIKIGHN